MKTMEKTKKAPLWRFFCVIVYYIDVNDGEGEIRTHATVARPNAFRVRPLITTWVLLHLERVRGIEPPPSAWEAEILPLNHTRKKRKESGKQDLNLRPPRPERGALPS